MVWRCLLITALSSLLYGCSLFPQPSEPAAVPPAPPTETPLPQSSGKAAEVPVPAPLHILPPKPKPPPPIAKPPANPDELIGLSEESVITLLGVPDRTGDEGTGRILTFRTKSCHLDVILFLDVKSGDHRVLSYQMNDGTPHPSMVNHCYDDVRSAR
jgi:hypothetical protein